MLPRHSFVTAAATAAATAATAAAPLPALWLGDEKTSEISIKVMFQTVI